MRHYSSPSAPPAAAPSPFSHPHPASFSHTKHNNLYQPLTGRAGGGGG